MAEALKVVGLMSGTSLDGVDAALLDTDGENFARPGHALSIPYSANLRAELREAIAAVAGLTASDPIPASVREAERRLTEVHADLVARLLAEAALGADEIALLGFHGQTILHRPKERWTFQIGDGALLAALTGIDTVNDFRKADVASGGEGAPFVPLYHAALARGAPGLALPAVVVNIGGVANVTYIDAEEILAFDTGPGNAPLDDWAQRHTGKPVDEDGRLARSGHASEAALALMLDNRFFARVPPKSLDRMDFGMEGVSELSPGDGAATLTAFTAASIARAAEHFPQAARNWIVCGGGRRNPTLMDELRRRLVGFVLTAEDMGWRGDFIEAEAFAYLAVRAVRGLPLSLPSTTGVPMPMSGGELHKRAA
jgi:anhydro-N-acetylmuramic acid kinase